MGFGYGLIAVPTGIVTIEVARARKAKVSTQVCPKCAIEGHDTDAVFCKHYGGKLHV